MNDDPQNGDTAQERAAAVAWYLCEGEAMSVANICSITGLSESGVSRLMDRLVRKLPIFRDDDGIWQALGRAEPP
jgi:DNA-binding IclR family transcriptional regulator